MAEPQTLDDLLAQGFVEDSQPQNIDDLLAQGFKEETQPTKVMTFEDDGLTVSAPASASDVDIEYMRHLKKAEKGQQSMFGAGVAEFFTTLATGVTVDPLKQLAESIHQEGIETSQSTQLELIERLAELQPDKGISISMGQDILSEITTRKLKDKPAPILKGVIDSADFVTKKVEDFKKRNGIIRPDSKWSGFLFDLSGVGASIMTSIGTFLVTKNPAATAAMFGVLQDSQVYKEARKSGMNPKEAASVAGKAGVAEGALEFVGLKIFNLLKIRPTKFRRILERSINEGFQELSQTSAEIAITTNAGIREFKGEQAAKDVGYSFFLGLLGGAGVNVTLETAQSLGKKKGLSEVEIDTAIESVQKNLDEITESFIEGVEADVNDASLDIQKADIAESQAIADKFSEDGELDTTKYSNEITAMKAIQKELTKTENKTITVGQKIASIGGRITEVKKQITSGLKEITGVTEENIVSVLNAFEFVKKKAKKPSETLISFLRKRGGLVDEGGNLKALDAPKSLIKNKTGEDLDDAALAAFEAGFFPEFTERPDINDLINAIEDETRGVQERFSIDPTDFLLLREDIARANQALDEIGVRLKDKADIKKVEKLQKRISKLQEGLEEKQVEKFVGERKGKILKEFLKKIPSPEKLAKLEVGEAQNVLTDVIKKSGISLKEQGKFLSAIKNTQTIAQLQKQLPSIRKRIEAAIERETRNLIKTRITRILKSVVTRQKAGRPVGKFVASVQEVFDRVLIVANRTQKENLIALEGTILGEVDAIEVTALRHFSGVATLEESQRTLEFLSDLQEFGAGVRLAKDTQRLISVQESKVKVLSEITNDGKAKARTEDESMNILQKIWSASLNSSFNWKTMMNVLSQNIKTSRGKSFVEEFGEVFQQRKKERKLILELKNKMFDKYQDLFNLKTYKQVQKAMLADQETAIIDEYVNAAGKSIVLKMSKAEARDRYAKILDPTLHEDTIFNPDSMAYTDDIVAGIREYIGEEGVAFVQWQIDTFYSRAYDIVNPVYAEINGVNLPNNPNYTPVTRDREGNIPDAKSSLVHEFENQYASVKKSSQISRVKNSIPLKDKSDIIILNNHIAEVAHYAAWAEKVRELNAVFNSKEVNRVIKTHFNGIDSFITQFIKDFANNGRRDRNAFTDVVEIIRRRFVQATLTYKLILGVKQQVSIATVLEEVSLPEFVRGSIEFALNPKENIEAMLALDLLELRGDEFAPELRGAEGGQGKTDKTIAKIARIGFVPIRLGDKTAIVIGGSILRNKLKKQGLSDSQIRDKVSIWIADTQQSTDIEQLTALQRNPAYRIMTTFLSSPIQYFNREISAIRNLKSGKITVKEGAQAIAIYHFILPMLFQFVSDAFEWDEENQKRAALLGSFNGLAIINDVLGQLYKSSTGVGFAADRNALFKSVSDVGRGLGDLSDGKLAEGVEDIVVGITKFQGLPSSQFEGFFEAIGEDIPKNKIDQGFKKILGYSKYQSEKK